MPHSSGGGSSGGGSGGGGSHGGGSYSSQDLHSIEHDYYPGARRYRYHHHGKTGYVYCNSDPSKKFSPRQLLIIIFYLPFIIGGIYGLISTMKTALGMHKPADTEIIIKDEANVLSSDDHLRRSLDAFYAKSGIVPAVITVKDRDWAIKGNLEKYAYDRYLSEFDDEMHWLIVYSEPSDGVNWAFEGMQGNYTDPLLTEKLTASFNEKLYTELKTSSSVDRCIADSFDFITPKIRKPKLSHYAGQIVPILLMLAFVLFHAYVMTGLNELKYKNAVYDPDPNEASQMESYARSMMMSPGGQFIAARTGITDYVDRMNTQNSNMDKDHQYKNDMGDDTLNSAPAGLRVCSNCGNTYRKDQHSCPICGCK